MKLFHPVALLSLFCGMTSIARGEVLPVRSYTTSDGMVSNFVQRIMRDSRGFLWFCTRGGLSRFDGLTFKNYTTADGLPNPTVNDIFETRAGEYWIATNGGGVVRFNPSKPLTAKDGKPGFRIIRVGEMAQTNRVNRIYEDRTERIWAATDGGVFRLEEANGHSIFRFVQLEPAATPSDKYGASSFAEDRAGGLWTATNSFGVIRIGPDGGVEVYTKEQAGMREGFVIFIIADKTGRIWMAGFDQLCLIESEPQPGASIVERCYRVIKEPTNNSVSSLYQSSNGRILITSLRGLGEFDGEGVHAFDPASLSDIFAIGDTVEDIEGNIWISSGANGAVKLMRKGFTHFAETYQRSGFFGIISIGEDKNGNVTAVNGSGMMFRLEGSRFVCVGPALSSDTAFLWLSSTILQDSTGQVWVLTSDKGLLRFPATNNSSSSVQSKPVAVYNSKNGLSNSPFRIYEDRTGDLWISTFDKEPDRLLRWERKTETFHWFTVSDGLPPYNSAFSFAEDKAGNLWIGFYDGGAGRFRNGKFEFFTAADGFPDRMVTDLYLDHDGRLWISSNTWGLLRVDEPEAEKPLVSARYTVANGLSSDDVRSIVEDNQGRIYVGTLRGIDRIDVATGNIAHFGMKDGLPSDFVLSSFRDRNGNLWFGTFKGAARLVPEFENKKNAPDIFITGLSAAGAALSISEIGEHQITGLEFSPTENNIQVDFGAISFAFGESLRFRYKLEGASEQWSAPTEERSVNLSLAPGSYRFIVQAVSSNGEPLSDKIAVVSFRILSPIWWRWWFLASAAALLAVIGYAAYRYRVSQLLKVERVRTRIASDLHDDIGASLSQIAVVSEVLQHQVDADDARVGKNLNLMARVSREAVDSMSDIVWAINPNKDNLQDLIRRMRRFASETLPNRNIELEFHAPEKMPNVKVGADFRREVFLIFKESVNNVLKHSGASKTEIDLRIENHWLVLRVSDNGKGMAEGGKVEGNGLRNMRQRSASLGGRFEILSNNGSGTTVSLRVPLHNKPT